MDLIDGVARIGTDRSVWVGDRRITAGQIIIATGSRPKPMGDAFLDAPVVEMERLFEQESFPENIVVTGNHVSTVEMAQFFRLIGRRVTLVTNSNYFLDGLDAYLVEEVTRRLASDKIELIKEGYPENMRRGTWLLATRRSNAN